MENAETHHSRSRKIHQERAEQVKKVKGLAMIVCNLHARGVAAYCKLPNEGRETLNDDMVNIVGKMTRRQAIQFLQEEQQRFEDFLAIDGNPGAHETRFGLQVRRLELIGRVLKEVPEEVDGVLVVKAVDVALNISSNFGIEELSLFQEAIESSGV
jgi:hypothetical protein